MSDYWPAVLVILLLGIALVALLQRLSRPPATLPYEARKALLTQSEIAFFHVLQAALEERCLIMAQVRVADLLKVVSGLEASEWRSAFNRIQSKHVDFVLCDCETLAILAAIELDDPTHERPDRQERDAFMDRAFDAAGIPLIHVPTQSDYDVDALRDELLAAIDYEG